MRQIIALGGGGFSMDMENLLLDRYILKQSRKSNPKICFLPTASADNEGYINKFYSFFENFECQPSHLSLFMPPTRDIEGYILEKDIIYVGGGNTKNLLAIWREWELDIFLKRAWQNGTILSGISAGSICWFEEGLTDSYGDGLDPLNCLGFIKGSNCPHYDGELERRPTYHKLIAAGKIKPGIATDDGVALHFIEEELHKVVSSYPKAKAYKITFNKEVIETELETEYLG